MPSITDRDYYQDLLTDQATRLFAPDEVDLEIYRAAAEYKVFEKISVNESDALANQLKLNQSSRCCFYLLSQQFSWGKIRLSEQSFNEILAAHRVFLPFLDYVLAFGSKTSQDEHAQSGFRYSQSFDEIGPTCRSYEMCYNIQFVEINGRSDTNPWSLRQSCIYEKIRAADGRSSWILLQPSQSLRTRLRHLLSTDAELAALTSTDPLLIHAIIISVAIRNWHAYIGYLFQKLKSLDDKACFSRVDNPSPYDYEIAFVDAQDLQLLRQKLFRTMKAIESSLNIVRGLVETSSKIERDMPLFQMRQSLDELGCCQQQFLGHRRDIEQLLKYSKGTQKLLSKVLDFRSARAQQQTTSSMETNIKALSEISKAMKQETSALANMAKSNYSDAKTLKTLSLIARMYLPASLVISIFSSQLIKISSPDAGSQKIGSVLMVSKYMWLFASLSLALTGLTFGYVRLMKQRWAREALQLR